MDFESISPYSNEVVFSHEATALDEIEDVVRYGHEAHLEWKGKTFAERAVHFQHLRQMLLNLSGDYGMIAAKEMGKPIGEAMLEVEKCADLCNFFSKNAPVFLQTEYLETESYKTMVTYEPLGVLLGVMPWNYPFWQLMRFAVPALMSGNAVIIKPSENAFQCAKALEHLFWEAGFPKHIFQVLYINEILVELAIKDTLVRGVAFTGSMEGGSVIASRAGKHLKKTVLELGGNDAFIIMPDADLEEAVSTVVKSRFGNSGQTCIAAKRLIVHDEVADKVRPMLLKEIKRLKMGDPTLRQTTLGPLARPDLADKIEQQVEITVKMGANVLMGGRRVENTNFYEPTVLTDIPKGSPAYQEELFGPVLSLFEVKSEEEAIELANDSFYGLGAAVWTNDLKRGERIARQLNVGTVVVNGQVKSDPRLPFGGIKMSGYGKELSASGIKEFVNEKVIVVD